MKLKNFLVTSFKGLIVGSSMLIPGVSGGTMAIILGIYNDLIHSVNNFFKDFKKSALLLFEFCVGAGIGFLLFSNLLSMALDKFELPMMYFFIGAILGGVPLLLKQTKADKGNKKDIVIGVIAFAFGVALVLSLGFIPETSNEIGKDFTFFGIIMQLITGIIVAVALVLPGISTSHMLLILGMYNTTLNAVKDPLHNIVFIASLGISVIIGVFLTTNILEKTMTKFPKVTYFVIIGFVIGSIIDVFPGFPRGWEILICAVTLVLGYIAIRFVSKFSNEN